MRSMPAPPMRLTWMDPDPETLLGPVLVPTAVEVVVERLATAFALDLYPSGSKLPPERELADRLGVSRGTVREAIAQLSDLGHVEVRLGRYGGSFVTSTWSTSTPAMVRKVLVDRWRELEDLFDLARELMPLIARLAAERRGDDDLRRIGEAVDAYETAADREQARAADAAIHRGIAEATGNAYFVSADAQLRSQLTLGTGAFPYTPDIVAAAVEDHRALLGHLRNGDGESAAATALTHFTELGESHLRALRERATS